MDSDILDSWLEGEMPVFGDGEKLGGLFCRKCEELGSAVLAFIKMGEIAQRITFAIRSITECGVVFPGGMTGVRLLELRVAQEAARGHCLELWGPRLMRNGATDETRDHEAALKAAAVYLGIAPGYFREDIFKRDGGEHWSWRDGNIPHHKYAAAIREEKTWAFEMKGEMQKKWAYNPTEAAQRLKKLTPAWNHRQRYEDVLEKSESAYFEALKSDGSKFGRKRKKE